MRLQFKPFYNQISGREQKFVSSDQKLVLKRYNTDENDFYRYFNSLNCCHPSFQILSFLPQYVGVLKGSLDQISSQSLQDYQPLYNAELQSQLKLIQKTNDHYFLDCFIVLKNFMFGFTNINGIDFKIGQRKPRFSNIHKPKRTNHFFFEALKIHLKVQNLQLSQIYLNKHSSRIFINTDQQILQNLGLFFFDGKTIRKSFVQNIIDKLRELILCLKSLKGWKLHSSSICIFYDCDNDQKFDIKLIDFARSVYTGSEKAQQEDSITGLQNLHRLLMEIKVKNQQIEKKVLNLAKRYIEGNVTQKSIDQLKKYNEQKNQRSFE